jgi:hypothetical protein
MMMLFVDGPRPAKTKGKSDRVVFRSLGGIDNRQSTIANGRRGGGGMDVLSGAHAAYSLHVISINLSAAWQGK